MSLFSKSWFHLLIGAVVASVIGLAGEVGCALETDRSLQDRRQHVMTELGKYRAALEGELNATLYLTNGLVTYVATHSSLEPVVIDSMLQMLYGQGRHIRSIGVAPDNRLSHVYPLAGNEKALGLYYPDRPDQWLSVKRAIDERRPVLAGPVGLRQGGVGLIYRVPIFQGAQPRYWGVVSMVLDMENLFQKTGVAPRAGDLELALRGKDGMGAEGAVFMGDARLFERQAVTTMVLTPGGSWQLAARPIEGWEAGSRVDWIRASAWTMGILLGLSVAYALAGVGRRLQAEKALRESQSRLQEQKGMLSAILENSNVGIAMIRDRQLVWCNPHMSELFGHALSAMEGQSTRMLYASEEAYESFGQRAYGELARTNRLVTEQEMRHRDGHLIWMRISGQAVDVENTSSGSIWVFEDIADRKRSEHELIRLATTDSLTGVANRHHFLAQFRAELARAKRFGTPAALLMMDLDHFKKVNDTFGHAVGDAVLQHFAGLAVQHTRRVDVVGRLGGEEFAVVLSGTDREGAVQFAQRFRQCVEDMQVPSARGPVRCTVSIGIATVEAGDEGPDAMFGRADEALYRAKAHERNTVEVAGAASPENRGA